MNERRVCLLTGAAGTLGSAFCRLYGATYHIVAAYRKSPPSGPSQFCRLVDPLNPRARCPENSRAVYYVQANLSQESELERLVEITLARHERIDLLVNAAVHYHMASLLESRALLEDAALMFEINTLVPLRLSAIVNRRFWRDRDRANRRLNRNIVNVSSTSGLNVYRRGNQGLYGATKAALNHLTCHMADEFRAVGVRVNALAPTTFPGVIPTACVAEAVCALDQSSLNGKIVVLDQDH